MIANVAAAVLVWHVLGAWWAVGVVVVGLLLEVLAHTASAPLSLEPILEELQEIKDRLDTRGQEDDEVL